MRGSSFLAATAVGAVPAGPWAYSPDSDSFTREGNLQNLAIPYNLSDSMRGGEKAIKASLWAGYFVHGVNHHDYFVVSHVTDFSDTIPGTGPSYRSSILDVTDTSYYQRHGQNVAANTSMYAPSTGALDANYGHFRMQATNTTDPLQGLHVTSSVEALTYDLSFDFSSNALLNGGLGCFWVAGGLGRQWSMPRGRTSGWLEVAGERVEIDSNRSFTWFDRQWGYSSSDFQWLMVHLPENALTGYSVLSIWVWEDAVNGDKVFATARQASTGLDSVIPVSVSTSTTQVWTSPTSGIVWPLQWTVELPGGVELSIQSIRQDSVIPGSDTIYTGYIDVVASKPGHLPIRGYGAVEALASF